ncbi:hypothetical protein TthHB5018_c25760 (plasmid) [Thermus thermophilus]|uniref:Uncharacterized protein n=1 Tax=Thermus thermophilus TaxID=274 RepID=A0A7R7YJN2_THETH|nr:hypothetical protein TthHB5018_c25760 [Thermus thermophilus]
MKFHDSTFPRASSLLVHRMRTQAVVEGEEVQARTVKEPGEARAVGETVR